MYIEEKKGYILGPKMFCCIMMITYLCNPSTPIFFFRSLSNLARLANHLQQEGIQFIQFAFRWMNCLLMREMPLRSTVRMWDTYLAEGSSEGFSEFHVYVCAAFLVKWSDQLQAQDFQVLDYRLLPKKNSKYKFLLYVMYVNVPFFYSQV